MKFGASSGSPYKVYGNILKLNLLKTIQQLKSAGKVMIIIFFDQTGVMCQHVIPPKTTVKGEYCTLIFKILWQQILRES